jgi:phospholipase C
MRLPLLVISPYGKENYVSHTLTDQTSILRFIEDNWLGGKRISPISFDNIAGSLHDMFDFGRPHMRRLRLDLATGLPQR